MRALLRIVFQLVISVLLFGVLWINVGLYYSPSYTTSGHSKINADVLAELRFLRSALHHGAAEDMQQLFPEGYVFLNALYGLSAASIVGIRALRVNEDISESMILRNSLEPFALPFRMGDTKRYLLGQLPMADAFLTWSQAAGQIDDRLDHQAWRVRFHGYCAAIGLILSAGYLAWRRRAKIKDILISKSVNP